MSDTTKANLVVGKKGTASVVVGQQHLACNMGSGLVAVFATPAMIALMEQAASECLQDGLNEGEVSVGSHIAASHVAPTPAGMKVTAEATITAIEGRKFKFSITAFDEREKVGEGTHERVVVNADRFAANVLKKSQTPNQN